MRCCDVYERFVSPFWCHVCLSLYCFWVSRNPPNTPLQSGLGLRSPGHFHFLSFFFSCIIWGICSSNAYGLYVCMYSMECTKDEILARKKEIKVAVLFPPPYLACDAVESDVTNVIEFPWGPPTTVSNIHNIDIHRYSSFVPLASIIHSWQDCTVLNPLSVYCPMLTWNVMNSLDVCSLLLVRVTIEAPIYARSYTEEYVAHAILCV